PVPLWTGSHGSGIVARGPWTPRTRFPRPVLWCAGKSGRRGVRRSTLGGTAMTAHTTGGRLHAFADLLRSDVVGGLLLIGGALAALAWANSPLGPSYTALREFSFGPEAL